MLLLGDRNSRIFIKYNFRYSLGKRFKYEPTLCGKRHDLMIKLLVFPVDRIGYVIYFMTLTK